MRQLTIPFCGFVLLVVCGFPLLWAGVAGAAPEAGLPFASVDVPLPLAHAGEGAGEGADAAQGGWRHFVSWVGHFHPAMTVFPIAMILSAALAELLRIWTKAPWLDGASRWSMIVGGFGAAITAPLGWAFAAGHGTSWTLEMHRWLGTAAGAGAVVLLVLSELARRRGGGALTLFRTVLFLAVPLVMATGFFGGAMVYGLHEYDWNPPQHHTDSVGGQDASAPGSGVGQAAPVVEMTDDDTFKPMKITVVAGATVRWHNFSKDEHTVTDDPHAASDSKDVSMPSGAAAFNSGKIKPGGSFEQKFTVPGTYKYVCEPHEEMDMKGEVVVTPAPAQ